MSVKNNSAFQSILPDDITLYILSFSSLPPSTTSLVCNNWRVCTDLKLRLKLFFLKFEGLQNEYFNEPYKPTFIDIINKNPTEYNQADVKMLCVAFRKIHNKLINPLTEKSDSNSKAILETLNYIGYFDVLRLQIAIEWDLWKKIQITVNPESLYGNLLEEDFERNIILPILLHTKPVHEVIEPLSLQQCIHLLHAFSLARIKNISLAKAVEGRFIEAYNSNDTDENLEMTSVLFYSYCEGIKGFNFNNAKIKTLFTDFLDAKESFNANELPFLTQAAAYLKVETQRKRILGQTLELKEEMKFRDLMICARGLLMLEMQVNNETTDDVADIISEAQGHLITNIDHIQNIYQLNHETRIKPLNEDAVIIYDYFNICTKLSTPPTGTRELLETYYNCTAIESLPENVHNDFHNLCVYHEIPTRGFHM